MVDKATTTTKTTRPEPTLEELRKKLAPKTRPEPTAEQKDKEARTAAVQSEIANFSDRLIGFLSFASEDDNIETDNNVEIDDEVVDHARQVYKYLELASKAAVAGVRAIPSSRYEFETPTPEA